MAGNSIDNVMELDGQRPLYPLVRRSSDHNGHRKSPAEAGLVPDEGSNTSYKADGQEIKPAKKPAARTTKPDQRPPSDGPAQETEAPGGISSQNYPPLLLTVAKSRCVHPGFSPIGGPPRIPLSRFFSGNFFGETERMIQANCLHCERPFRPRRSTARFCSSRCRLSSHRSVGARASLTATETATVAAVSVSGPAGLRKQSPAISETLRTRRPLPRGIVPDAKWSGMYRLRLS